MLRSNTNENKPKACKDVLVERLIEADDGARLWVRDVGPTGDVGVDAQNDLDVGLHGDVDDQNRPVVLCCHGGPGVADYLEPVEEALAEHYRVVRWDQRGSGRSDAAGPFTIDRFVADMENVRAAMGLQRPVLFGHSWGANLVMHYAMLYPNRPNAIAYVAGNGLQWWPEFTASHKRRQVERLGPVAGQRLEELRSVERFTTKETSLDEPSEAEARELRLLYIRSEMHDTTDIASAERLYTKEQVFPLNREANAELNRQARNLTLEDQITALKRVACPVLVLHGASDPRPVEALASMVGALRNARVKVLQDAGHNPWLEQPTSLWLMVRTLIEGASDQPG